MAIGDYSNIIMQGKRNNIADIERFGSGLAAMGSAFRQGSINKQIQEEMDKGEGADYSGGLYIPEDSKGDASKAVMGLNPSIMQRDSTPIWDPSETFGKREILRKKVDKPEAEQVRRQMPGTATDWARVESLARDAEARGLKPAISSAEIRQRRMDEAAAKQQEWSNALAEAKFLLQLNGDGDFANSPDYFKHLSIRLDNLNNIIANPHFTGLPKEKQEQIAATADSMFAALGRSPYGKDVYGTGTDKQEGEGELPVAATPPDASAPLKLTDATLPEIKKKLKEEFGKSGFSESEFMLNQFSENENSKLYKNLKSYLVSLETQKDKNQAKWERERDRKDSLDKEFGPTMELVLELESGNSDNLQIAFNEYLSKISGSSVFENEMLRFMKSVLGKEDAAAYDALVSNAKKAGLIPWKGKSLENYLISEATSKYLNKIDPKKLAFALEKKVSDGYGKEYRKRIKKERGSPAKTKAVVTYED